MSEAVFSMWIPGAWAIDWGDAAVLPDRLAFRGPVQAGVVEDGRSASGW